MNSQNTSASPSLKPKFKIGNFHFCHNASIQPMNAFQSLTLTEQPLTQNITALVSLKAIPCGTPSITLNKRKYQTKTYLGKQIDEKHGTIIITEPKISLLQRGYCLFSITFGSTIDLNIICLLKTSEMFFVEQCQWAEWPILCPASAPGANLAASPFSCQCSHRSHWGYAVITWSHYQNHTFS